jgi:hypothetical protein
MKQAGSHLSSTLLALLLLVVAAIVFFEFVESAYANLMTLRGQEAGEQQFLAAEQKIATQANTVFNEFQTGSQGAQAVDLAMPVGPDSAGALAQLYGIAADSSLIIQSVGVSLSAPPPQASANTASTASTAALIKPYGSLNFQVTADGTYESLQTFLQGLETNVRIFDVTQLSVHQVTQVTSAGAAATGNQDFFTYTFTAVAYYQSP